MTHYPNLYSLPKPLVTAAGAEFPYDPALAKMFTFVDRFEKQYTLYQRKGNTIVIPRNVAPLGHEDLRVRGQDVYFDINFKPRSEEQSRVVQESYDLLDDGISHIVRAPTGFGKTYIGAALIGMVGKKTLITVVKSDTIKQWVDALKAVLRLPDSKIGHLQGDKCQVGGKDVVIGMVHSICKQGRYPAEVYKEFGFNVVDEVHMMGADTFNESMWLFPSYLRLGLSATPRRSDNREKTFFYHIGPIMVSSAAMPMIPKVIMVKSGFKLPRITRRIDGVLKTMQIPHSPGRCAHIHKIMRNNTERNDIIVCFVKQAWEKDRRTIVFSEQKLHLEILHKALVKSGIPAKDIAFYMGGIKEDDLEKAKHKPIILATYAFTSMATDIPWLDTCVLGTPRSDVEQIVGRVIREYPDKKQPVVFDILDEDSSVFSGFYEKRVKFYNKIKAAIVKK